MPVKNITTAIPFHDWSALRQFCFTHDVQQKEIVAWLIKRFTDDGRLQSDFLHDDS